ncbi:hypothetical protein AMK23_18380 [Streptomyces sp. CB02130]|nr:hypothetical protein AMK23_18380 [Streptomyces sp. CB02130]
MERIHRLLAERLPKQVRGWPAHFRHADPADPVGHMELTAGPVDHRVSVDDVDGLPGAAGGCAGGGGRAGLRRRSRRRPREDFPGPTERTRG